MTDRRILTDDAYLESCARVILACSLASRLDPSSFRDVQAHVQRIIADRQARKEVMDRAECAAADVTRRAGDRPVTLSRDRWYETRMHVSDRDLLT